MFTGLTEGTAEVVAVAAIPAGRRLTLRHPLLAGEPVGASVALNGCCLTVVECQGETAAFEAGPETLAKTNLGGLRPGDAVNVERALPAGGRLGGHLVQGHIDGTATVREVVVTDDWRTVWFACGPLADDLVPKGSVAVDGVSLTVVDVTADAFSAMLIPHTLAVTTLGRRGVGDRVNIETDILGKYVRKQLAAYVNR